MVLWQDDCQLPLLMLPMSALNATDCGKKRHIHALADFEICKVCRNSHHIIICAQIPIEHFNGDRLSRTCGAQGYRNLVSVLREPWDEHYHMTRHYHRMSAGALHLG